MKMNAPKRKIFDAVDVLVGDSQEKVVGGTVHDIQMIPLDQIKPFHDHPFRLYEGERLQDMVESVRTHGVLSPVIVQKQDGGYEMLAGHNRLNAAKIAQLAEIPAIVKTGLTEEEAYVYVIETNLIQRSFSELLPSEKAVVLSERYEKISCQGRRNDIRQEIEILNGKTPEEKTCGHDVHKLKTRDGIGEEYGMTGRNIARYMRVNHLIDPLKELLDRGELALVAAVDLSYLEEKEQELVAEQIQCEGLKISLKTAKVFREAAGDLDRLNAILHPAAGTSAGKTVSVKMPAEAEEKYFSGMKAKERTELVMQALDAWFARDGYGFCRMQDNSALVEFDNDQIAVVLKNCLQEYTLYIKTSLQRTRAYKKALHIVPDTTKGPPRSAPSPAPNRRNPLFPRLSGYFSLDIRTTDLMRLEKTILMENLCHATGFNLIPSHEDPFLDIPSGRFGGSLHIRGSECHGQKFSLPASNPILPAWNSGFLPARICDS